MQTSATLYTENFKVSFEYNEMEQNYYVTTYDRRIDDEGYETMDHEQAQVVMCAIIMLGDCAVIQHCAKI